MLYPSSLYKNYFTWLILGQLTSGVDRQRMIQSLLRVSWSNWFWFARITFLPAAIAFHLVFFYFGKRKKGENDLPINLFWIETRSLFSLVDTNQVNVNSTWLKLIAPFFAHCNILCCWSWMRSIQKRIHVERWNDDDHTSMKSTFSIIALALPISGKHFHLPIICCACENLKMDCWSDRQEKHKHFARTRAHAFTKTKINLTE